jgi:hypothetical protein
MLSWILACAAEPGRLSPLEPLDAIAARLPARPVVLSVEANPNPTLPHEQIIDVTLSATAAIAVECTLDADPSEVHLVESRPSDSHEVRINGLLADEAYTCAVAITSPRTAESATSFTLTTPRARYEIPPMEVARDESLPMNGGAYTIFNQERYCGGESTQRLLIVDPEARVRWHYELPAGMDMGVEARPNSDGNIVWGGGNTSQSAAEIVSLSGELLYKVDFSGADRIAFHHDGKQISTGEILTLEYSQNYSDTATWRGFSLRTFDPATGDETWEWQSQYGFDQGVLPSGRGDVYHANWVDILDGDDGPTAYVSMCARYQVMAVDVATKDVKWLFGPGGDFALYDTDGTALADSYFTSCQHGLEFDPDTNRLLVYDNGWATGHSRTAEFQLDLDAMTATLEWSWTETGWYESVLGDADWLPDDHVLLDQAHMECANPTGRPTQIVEVDQATGGVPWRLTLPRVNDASYRAERIPSCTLFRNSKYCAATAERLGELAPLFDE